jgi:hypothetical protein
MLAVEVELAAEGALVVEQVVVEGQVDSSLSSTSTTPGTIW